MSRAIESGIRSFVLVASFALAMMGSTAGSSQERAATAAPARQTWTGRVCRPDGSPAEGAVVVTSADGRAVTAADGSFALALELPRDAESLDVTATLELRSGRSLRASMRLVPSTLGPRGSLGLLQLQTSVIAPAGWRATFGEKPGCGPTGTFARALAVFDDGNGPALFVGGNFDNAGGVATGGLARWDGAHWAALGSGIDDVNALAVFDDGNGPALYAGGTFTTAGGITADHVARWDGTDWTALGSGVNGYVYSLATFDDGSGPALYVGGIFTIAGDVHANRVARWDGATWTTPGDGMNSSVTCLTAFDDGSGAALYAGGSFTTAGGIAAARIARWDGTTWSALGSGLDASASALAVFDDGSGADLYAGGSFAIAGGTGADHIARWNGASWSALGSGVGPVGSIVNALAVFDDGTGAGLYAGGSFMTAGNSEARHVARWDGSNWSALGTGIAQYDPRFALAVYDDGSGPELYSAGEFVSAGDAPALDIAHWNGTRWASLGTGFNDSVRALVTCDMGGGPELYAGGKFTGAAGAAALRVARWDGSSWSPLGSGMDDTVSALAQYDDGNGTALYAGGRFDSAGGVPAHRIAKWDGSTWSALGSGTGSGPAQTVNALATFDDGSGEALYVGGSFTSAGGVSATQHIARWNGTNWSSLGGANDDVNALVVFDDGNGPALYAGGRFTSVSGVPASCIARWDGASWTSLGSGIGASSMVPVVNALAVHDNGQGPALFAAGSFSSAGGVSRTNIARWDGTTWFWWYAGIVHGQINSLAVYDDGSGPALFVGGGLTNVDGLAVNRVARLDDTVWSALGSGVPSNVYALAGTSRGLYVGGDSMVTPAGDSYLANWTAKRKAIKND